MLCLIMVLSYGTTEKTNASSLEAEDSSRSIDDEITVAGTYAGSVIVEAPAPLGALDLVLEITGDSGTLSGQVNAARTQVFLGGPTFTGSVNASEGMTPTIRIESEVFESTVARRPIQRQFVLTGEVQNDGDRLVGEYQETITGFTPKPMQVTGSFLIVRPGGSEQILPSKPVATPTPAPTNPGGGSTPTPSATPTPTSTSAPTPGGGTPSARSVYLPVASNQAVASSDAKVVLEAAAEAETTTATDQDTLSSTPPSHIYLPLVQRVGAITSIRIQRIELVGPPATLLVSSDKLVLTQNDGTATITAVVRDANGLSIPDVTVTFASDSSELDPTPTLTDAEGRAITYYTAGLQLGQVVVTANIGEPELSRATRFQVVKPQRDQTAYSLSLEGDVDEVEPGKQLTVQAHLRDATGQPLAGEVITFFGSFGEVTPSNDVTDNEGMVSVTYHAGTVQGQGRITALAGYASKSIEVRVGKPQTTPTPTPVTPTPSPEPGSVFLPLVKK